jgi:hypothetical protein
MNLFCRWQEVRDNDRDEVICVAHGTSFDCNYQIYDITIDTKIKTVYIEGCPNFIPVKGLTKRLLEQTH